MQSFMLAKYVHWNVRQPRWYNDCDVVLGLKCVADQLMQWENGTNGLRIGSYDVGSQVKKTMTTLW